MASREFKTYMKAVASELREVGPFERRRVLKQVHADVWELATAGRARPATEVDLVQAIQASPAPEEVAESYVETSPPPVATTRIALVTNALLSITAIILGWVVVFLHTNMDPLLLAITAVPLSVVGVVGSLFYGIALLRIQRAMPWRLSVLPAVSLCVFFDGFLAMALIVSWGYSWPLSLGAFLSIFLGGAYSVAYAHRQLPRFAHEETLSPLKGGYFALVARKLRVLDLVRRRSALAELREHVREAGIDFEGLDPTEQRRAIEGVLGPPIEVATAYLQGAETTLGQRSNRALWAALSVAALGVAIGVSLLATGISVWGFGGYLTPLGLIGSAGLFVLGAALISLTLRVFRAPAKVADLGIPLGALTAAIALVVSGVVAAVPSGGLLGQWETFSYEVIASVPTEDDGLAVIWAAYRDSMFGPPTDFPPVEAGITHLDANRNVVALEPLPGGTTGATLLDVGQENDQWFALFSDSLRTWGASNRYADLSPPSSWKAVDGRLEGRFVQVAWADHLEAAGLLQIDFVTFEGPYKVGETRWSRTFPLRDVYDLRVAVGQDTVLVVAALGSAEESYARSALSIHLLDWEGNPIVATNLLERNVTWTGPEDRSNGTSLHVEGLHAIEKSFWVSGLASTSTGGTTAYWSWAVRIDEVTGAATEWELQRIETPTPSFPRKPGDRDILPFPASHVDSGRVFVASSFHTIVVNTSGLREPSPDEGGLYLTSLRAIGEKEYTVRLGDASIREAILLPLLSSWEGGVTVFAYPVGRLDKMVTYSLVGSSTNVTSHEVPLDIGETALLFWAAYADPVGRGLGPSLTEFDGEARVEDPGFLGWRSTSPQFLRARAPAILRVDHVQGTTELVLLTPPRYMPDIILGLLATAGFTLAGVLAVTLGYPRWRLWRAMRQRISE